MDGCWFCDDERPDPAPGGWLVDDGTFRAGHAPATYSCAGTVILETRRHATDQSDFDPQEAARLASVTGELIAAIRTVTDCDRVYQWATMDGFPHFHLWLIPWWEASALRGPRYLAATVVEAEGCSEQVAEETARRLHDALGPAIE